MREKLRVGLLVDSDFIPAWAYEMISKIHKSDYADIKLIIKNSSSKSGKSADRSGFNYLAYNLYRKIDRAIFRPTVKAFSYKEIDSLLPLLPVLDVSPVQKGDSDYFKDEDIARIDSYKPDVLIRLGFRILRGKILTVAKHGIWSFHFGDNKVNRGGPPGFWEVMHKWPETGSVLQVLTEDIANGHVIQKSYSATNPFSVNKNINNLSWRSCSMLPRSLEKLHANGGEIFFNGTAEENAGFKFYSGKLYKKPGNVEMVKEGMGLLLRYLSAKMKSVVKMKKWILLFNFNDDITTSLWNFKKIIPPKDRMWADPFIVFKNEKYYIFIEELLYKSNKGHISVFEMGRDGEYTAPSVILEKPFHLSYPFVFEHLDDHYLVPESGANKTIELYKCTDFPYKWVFVKNLMEDVTAVDSTFMQYNGKWWLFVNMTNIIGASTRDELFLHYTDDILNPDWISHPLNPIVSDVKSARPAGKIFTRNGKMYRPSQDCSIRYGYALKFNEILKLSETEYVEAEVATIKPEWEENMLGTHTFNSVEGLTVVDALVEVSKY